MLALEELHRFDVSRIYSKSRADCGERRRHENTSWRANRFSPHASLEHDPEKWMPVFRKDRHAGFS
jgi:hypothetical protein